MVLSETEMRPYTMNNKSDAMKTATTSPGMRLLRWLAIGLLLALLVGLSLWLLGILFSWVIVPAVVESHTRELGRLLGWPDDIVWLVSIPLALVASALAGWLFGRDARRRRLAFGGLAAMAVIYFGFHAWLSRNHLYDQKGRPLFYWGLTPAGEIHKQSEPGLNPYTHKPLLPASREYLALVRARLSEPLRSVSPATNEWFDVNMGWPLLWYHRTSQGEFEFYQRPAIHPRYQVELQAVTVELRQEWEREQNRLAAEAETRNALEREEKRKQDKLRSDEAAEGAAQERERKRRQRRQWQSMQPKSMVGDSSVARESTAV